MKSDAEIRRFVSNLETDRELFLLLDLITQHFNAFSTIVTEQDITGTFQNAVGREPTDEEFDMIHRLCEASLEDYLTERAMTIVHDICMDIAGTKEEE